MYMSPSPTLTGLGDVAANDVLDLGPVDLGHLVHQRDEDVGHQLVRALVDEGTLVGSPDRAAGGGDDDGVVELGHGCSLGCGDA
jgi:hypothetical protein